jgi:hypothetical protein
MVDAELEPAFLRLAVQRSADLERNVSAANTAFDELHRLKNRMRLCPTGERQCLSELPLTLTRTFRSSRVLHYLQSMSSSHCLRWRGSLTRHRA